MAGEQAISLEAARLAVRHARSQRSFYASLAEGSPGARLITLAGVEALAVPIRPSFALFNVVFSYADAESLAEALPLLEEQYAGAGVSNWSVAVPEHDHDAEELLQRAGFARGSAGVSMASFLQPHLLAAPRRLDLVPDPSWELVAECNDRAYGIPPELGTGAVFAGVADPAFHRYAARGDDGEVKAALVTREQDGDCYMWLLATVPSAQRVGVGAELVRQAFSDALARGCTSGSGESTQLAEKIYERLEAQVLARPHLWERAPWS